MIGIDGMKIAVAGGYFRTGAAPEALTALERVAAALAARREIEIPRAARARAAAYVITATEGAALHLDRLRTRAHDFDPAVRDRLIAGAMVPATLVNKAQKFRRWYRARVLELFDRGRCHPGARDAVYRAADRSADLRARRRRAAGARQSRDLYPADFLHRPAGRRRAGAAQAAADRRADHRGALA